ncbi:MAG: sigma-70 family RNA polymerase sigma factor [Micromonosporaceae bacterium]|nr:sigma-70 family RNA polymerase sigma factor [Micromonosporaceae bacterium]
MCAAVLDLAEESERYRRELVAYCYRMLGSGAEAEDAAQEALVRAWRGGEGFEGRSSLRSWLYRIATNVCIDMQRAPQRRALPMDLSGPRSLGPEADIGVPLEQTAWIEPIHDSRVVPESADPAQRAVLRESVRLALVTALQRLPARQRAVLVLRDVLDWSAAEVAELLDTTVASVNSALARARSTMAGGTEPAGTRQLSDGDRSLLDRYVAAFEAYDVAALVALLHEDATFTMPPYLFWMRGRADIQQWWSGPGTVCRNSRLLLTRANGGPAVAVYHPAGDKRWEPFAIHVLDVREGRIGGICHFLETGLFPAFELPAEITA